MADKADIILEEDTVSVRGTGASPVVDVEGGGHWNLNLSEGDVRIGDDGNNLRMGVGLGDAGEAAGIGQIWASTELRLGSGGDSIASVEDSGLLPANGRYNLGTPEEPWERAAARRVQTDQITVNSGVFSDLKPINLIDPPDPGTVGDEFGDLRTDGGGSRSWNLGSDDQRWGTLYVDSTNTTSDRRLKTDIEDLEGGLDAVLDLRPVSYRWRNNGDETKLGLIGQEVAEVLPEVVDLPDGDDGYLGLDYDEIVAVLIEAVQEQQAEREALADRVDSQRDRIEDQRARIDDLEERLAALEAEA